MPLVKRSAQGVNWLTNKIIDVSPDGEKIAFVSARGNSTNIFVKGIHKMGAAVQRTNRTAVLDFSYSPDGKFIAFSEDLMKKNAIFQTDANNGFVCRQITSGNLDYSPVYSSDNGKIYFSRQETKTASIWSYDLKNNFLSSYSIGMNPYPSSDEMTIFCTRVNGYGNGEIWKVDFGTGIEECIVSDSSKSFSTPSISPDGEWILFVGSTPVQAGSAVYWNTDIYICRVDGSELTQLTYHAADDLSPVWSKDGQSIFFISQRGSATGTANIWRINFNHQ